MTKKVFAILLTLCIAVIGVARVTVSNLRDNADAPYEVSAIPLRVTTISESTTTVHVYYTLIFVTNGGSEIGSMIFDSGISVDLSYYVTTRSCYEFAGWYDDADLLTQINSVTMDSEKIVYAKWVLSSTGHDYDEGTVTKEATCTENGVMTYTCKSCGESYTEEIPATGHSWDEGVVTKEATGTSEGEMTYTCTVCGDTKTESIPKITFTVVWVNEDGTVLETDTDVVYGTTPSYDGETPTKAANAQYTYTFAGWTPEISDVTGDVTYTATYSATVNTYTVRWLDEDGTELEKDTDVAYGTEPSYDGQKPTKASGLQYHYTFDDWTPTVSDVTGDATYTATYTQTAHTTEIQNAKEATCTEDGYTGDTVCTVCWMTISTGTVIPATGHTYEAVVTAPTCTETGYTTYTCSVCGDSYVADETAALGHSYEAVVTAPTCTEQGYTTHTCSVCGDSYVDTYTAALGHTYEFQYFTWSNDLSTATATFKCKTCGELYTLDATISGVGSLGVSVHTASVTFEGETYSDSVSTGTSLLKTAADYTAINDAISIANALNASDYSNFELVTAAIDAVNWNLSIINQETVTAYAENIEAAIANLVPVAEETVTITEPVEDSTTESEPEEEEVTVPETETNPTTGIVVALLPMAIVTSVVIFSKKR
ncbi:MAG: InlB B-repeat-containing protein [Oscillospiraceae bacterium]|nr:InlB B-repeat-containing protein [Oscillospiraceae bacterium]